MKVSHGFLVTLTSIATYWLQSVPQVFANGICYDPNYHGQKSDELMIADMKKIKDFGFNYVRTYWTQDGNTNMGKLITEQGLNVALGIPFPAGDAENHIKAAIEAAQGKGPGKVIYIFVGNENFANNKQVPKDMLDIIARIKKEVPGVKVGTVQRQTEFLDPNQAVNGMKELVEACDVVGLNIHPFFTPNTDATRGIQIVNDQWSQLQESANAKYPGLKEKMAITEIGWPSAGSSSGSVGSIENSKAFFKNYLEWSQSIPADKKFYFQMFDQPQRGRNGEGEFEKFFGIFTTDGEPKVDGPIPSGNAGGEDNDDAPGIVVAPDLNSSSSSFSNTTTRMASGVCKYKSGVNFKGEGIGEAPSVNVKECCSLCQKTMNCTSFVWSKEDGEGTCYFKSGRKVRFHDKSVIAGFIQV